MLAAMMGGGGLPPFPCPICVVELTPGRPVDVSRWGRNDPEPANVTTMVLGTPVCTAHAERLVDALAELAGLAGRA